MSKFRYVSFGEMKADEKTVENVRVEIAIDTDQPHQISARIFVSDLGSMFKILQERIWNFQFSGSVPNHSIELSGHLARESVHGDSDEFAVAALDYCTITSNFGVESRPPKYRYYLQDSNVLRAKTPSVMSSQKGYFINTKISTSDIDWSIREYQHESKFGLITFFPGIETEEHSKNSVIIHKRSFADVLLKKEISHDEECLAQLDKYLHDFMHVISFIENRHTQWYRRERINGIGQEHFRRVDPNNERSRRDIVLRDEQQMIKFALEMHESIQALPSDVRDIVQTGMTQAIYAGTPGKTLNAIVVYWASAVEIMLKPFFIDKLGKKDKRPVGRKIIDVGKKNGIEYRDLFPYLEGDSTEKDSCFKVSLIRNNVLHDGYFPPEEARTIVDEIPKVRAYTERLLVSYLKLVSQPNQVGSTWR